NSIVKRNTGPSGADFNSHLSRWSLSRIELNDRLSRRFVSEVLRSFLGLDIRDANTPTATGVATCGVRTVFGDAENAHACQRLRVGGNYAVGSDYENPAQFIGVAGTNLNDSGIMVATVPVCALK